MARSALKQKQHRHNRFTARNYRRCLQCGRSQAVLRQFALCRICFRKLAAQGEIPGVKKAS